MEGAMFKTIVVALDGSEGAQRAASVGAEIAKREGAKLVIAHVNERTIGKGGGDLRADEDEVAARIESEADELRAGGIEASVEKRDVMVGGPAHAISEVAEQAGADLIVTGTRGQNPVSGLLLGSVTQRLLHIAKCPVLVVPSD
jgi:nucleotide-binding universal stress UspA family protein